MTFWADMQACRNRIEASSTTSLSLKVNIEGKIKKAEDVKAPGMVVV